jgi:hypothetical protein
MDGPGSALRAAVAHALPHLRTISNARASTPRAHGKWSPKEIIGHLIDSASNNHQRFVRAQLPDARPFDGYAQDDWVKLQRYNEADWLALVDLWAAFNLHLAQVMDHTSEDESRRPRPDLQLTRLSFRSASEPVSLGWFMEDYVEHLKHHLRQIDPALASDRTL